MNHEWTPIESAEFEAAREAISHLMAIYTTLIRDEKTKLTPDKQRLDELYSDRGLLHWERDDLTIHDKELITKARTLYSAKIRDYLERGIPPR